MIQVKFKPHFHQVPRYQNKTNQTKKIKIKNWGFSLLTLMIESRINEGLPNQAPCLHKCSLNYIHLPNNFNQVRIKSRQDFFFLFLKKNIHLCSSSNHELTHKIQPIRSPHAYEKQEMPLSEILQKQANHKTRRSQQQIQPLLFLHF